MQLFQYPLAGRQQLLLVFAQLAFSISDLVLPGFLFLVGVFLDIGLGFSLIIAHAAIVIPIKRRAKSLGFAITEHPPSKQLEGAAVGCLSCVFCLFPVLFLALPVLLGIRVIWVLLVVLLWVLALISAVGLPMLMIYMLVVDVRWYRFQLSSGAAGKPSQTMTGVVEGLPRTCSVCGRPIPPNAQFCPGCGAGAETAKSPR